jgi:NADPH-dependent 2,4-dienoyl-CoA reductase/sulfur reductase-like enzyme
MNLKGKRVVVVGAGSTGCETADYIFEHGADTTVIEMSAGVALDAGVSDRTRMMNRLNTLPIQFLTSTRCLEIKENGVRIADSSNSESFLPADIVVLAAGVRPNNQLFQAIHDQGIEAHMAGDCWHSGQIARAVADGARVGHLL